MSSPHRYPVCFANPIKGTWLVLSCGLGRGGLWATFLRRKVPPFSCSLQEIKHSISNFGWVFYPAIIGSHHPGQETRPGLVGLICSP